MKQIKIAALFIVLIFCFSCRTERIIANVNLYIGIGGYVQAYPGDSLG
jgi:hypothetical protein